MRGEDRSLRKPFICPVCKGDSIGVDPIWNHWYYPPESCCYCDEEGVVGPLKYTGYYLGVTWGWIRWKVYWFCKGRPQ
jgi:hypothetical protein